MMINLTRWYYRGDNKSRAKHLKIVLHEIYVLPIKNYIWNKFIDTKHGWQDYIMIDGKYSILNNNFNFFCFLHYSNSLQNLLLPLDQIHRSKILL